MLCWLGVCGGGGGDNIAQGLCKNSIETRFMIIIINCVDVLCFLVFFFRTTLEVLH